MKSLRDRLLPPESISSLTAVFIDCCGQARKKEDYDYCRKYLDAFIKDLCARIDALEAEAIKVGTLKDYDGWIASEHKNSHHTHTALLIDIQPIERESTTDELTKLVLELAKSLTKPDADGSLTGTQLKILEIVRRLEREGVKK